MTEQPTAYDYMVGVLLMLKVFEKDTSDIKEKAEKLSKNLSKFKDLKDVYLSTLHTEVEEIASSLDIANLHNENAQKRVVSTIEKLKKVKE